MATKSEIGQELDELGIEFDENEHHMTLRALLKDEKEKEDKPKVKRDNKKRIIKKSKRVRAPKVSS